MKLKWTIYALLLLMLLATAACHTGETNTKQPSGQAEDIYTCSMHPQIHEHHPGNCPICGMVLIKKNMTATASANESIQLETLLKPTVGFVIASLPVTTAKRKNINTTVKAYGIIEYDTRAAGTISARVSGRIEKLYVRYRYQAVEKGQKIMDIYSPEILIAEQNLLFLLQNDAANTSFVQAAKEKLLLLGISTSQLQQVIRDKKPLYSVTVYSNYSGHVHDAGMTHDGVLPGDLGTNPTVTEELSLKEGMYVQKGQTLLMLMNHDKVWAALQVFTSDQSLVKMGSPVSIVPETDTTSVIKGRIDFIEPFFRPNSKTITARVYFQNMAMLPVGSHVTATISTAIHNALWLPQSAVLSLGMNDVVFVKNSVGFMAHKITTSIRTDNFVQVTSGISEQDTVAVNAQYFIDSESFIRTSSK